jgi:uncharacterized protein GlcG (DUF336 family)
MPLLARSSNRTTARKRSVRPQVERLEDRSVPSVSATLSGAGVLTVNGDLNAVNRIFLTLNSSDQIVVSDGSQVRGVFASSAVTDITVNANGFNNYVDIANSVTQMATINGGPGNNYLIAGGGATTLVSGTGTNRLVGGNGSDTFDATQGNNTIEDGNGVSTVNLAPRATTINTGILGNLNPPADSPVTDRTGSDTVLGFKDRESVSGLDPTIDRDLRAAVTPPNFSQTLGIPPSPDVTITSSQVGQLLDRAAAATSYDSAIVAIVDRNGDLLGLRVEGGVSSAITSNADTLVFAIDGALAEARTAAFFSTDAAPLTSRTIEYISQTTITQREVESNPSILNPASTIAGPGTVGPIGIGGEFPPGILNTALVDLFDIEATNTDGTDKPIYNSAGDVTSIVDLMQRFNINPAFIPSYQSLLPDIDGVDNQIIATPNSYGVITGIEADAQPRGIGTLPGGIPLYENGTLVGGIGVFFPGTTGYADAENSALSANYNPNEIDMSEVAEYIGFAAAGGSSGAGFSIGTLGGIAPLKGFDLPSGQINLVGIQLPIYGPPGNDGTQQLVQFGQTLGIGNADSFATIAGTSLPGFTPPSTANPNLPVDTTGDTLLDGMPAPEGWLVLPHAGTTLTADQVDQIIVQAVQQADETRAQIRLPLDATTRMVIAVTDPETGDVLGLFRMPDSPIFSIDVAVAKGRNNAYYADADQLQSVDQLPGIPAGTAFSSRTYRYLASPFFPEGDSGAPPGPFSILNVPGTNPTTGLNTGAPVPESDFLENVMGHNNFFPGTNFHDPFNLVNQNGIVFFPGGVPLYADDKLGGGLGVSGDGVDEDDVVTAAGAVNFGPPSSVQTIDQLMFEGIRLPYQLFDRNPTNL